MSYTARWYRNDELVAEQRCADLPEAKQVAKERFPFHRSSSGATSALVCDEEGVVYLRIY